MFDKRVMLRAEFRKRVRDEIETICDHGPQKGKPKPTILGVFANGKLRDHMTINIAHRVVEAVRQKVLEEGFVLEPELAALTAEGKAARDYGRSVLASMSAIEPNDRTHPVEAIIHCLGSIIPVGKTPATIGQRSVLMYVAARSATPMDVQCCLNILTAKSAGGVERFTRVKKILLRGHAAMGDRALGAAWASEVERFHLNAKAS